MALPKIRVSSPGQYPLPDFMVTSMQRDDDSTHKDALSIDLVNLGGFQGLQDYLGTGIMLSKCMQLTDTRFYIRDPELPPTWWHYHISIVQPSFQAIEYDMSSIPGIMSKYYIPPISPEYLRKWLSEHYTGRIRTVFADNYPTFYLPKQAYPDMTEVGAKAALSRIVDKAFRMESFMEDPRAYGDPGWLGWLTGSAMIIGLAGLIYFGSEDN